MKIALKETRLGLLNSTTRLPFRYGKACLTKCPQAVLEVAIETSSGRQQGYSGDCLPPGWFDKSPGKSYQQQIDEMLWMIDVAEKAFKEALHTPGELFPAWLNVSREVQQVARERGLTALLASFGLSMVERAMIDAMCRAASLSFQQAVQGNLFEIDAGSVHSQLKNLAPRDWLPGKPVESIFVRHTIGLADPLTSADIADDEQLNDGFPQSLEQYVQRSGIRYLKIKVSNHLDDDLQRLEQIAHVVEAQRGGDYQLTLDGNEQYTTAAEFEQLVDRMRTTPALATLAENVVAIEQPLQRDSALASEHAAGIERLSRWRPVIIDESDDHIDSYAQAIELGYRGTSSKNCKGTFKSLLNAGLTCHLNSQSNDEQYIMTGEDLCSVGVVPVQADLCLVATLGLTHIERNGHHYHPGLSYLPEAQQQAALREHPDLYREQHGVISPCLSDGELQIGSLQCVGFGFGVVPVMNEYIAADQWNFDSLGLTE